MKTISKFDIEELERDQELIDIKQDEMESAVNDARMTCKRL